MEERTTQSSLAEKMNQLYAEREEQYRRRENFLMNVLRSYSHYQIPWKKKKMRWMKKTMH